MLLLFISATVCAQKTQKPVIHGKNWMAITGKPLAATLQFMFSERDDKIY